MEKQDRRRGEGDKMDCGFEKIEEKCSGKWTSGGRAIEEEDNVIRASMIVLGVSELS